LLKARDSRVLPCKGFINASFPPPPRLRKQKSRPDEQQGVAKPPAAAPQKMKESC
jgi:hypothetical protein